MLVEGGEVLRVGPGGMTGRAYVQTAEGWELSRRVTAPEGWYVVPPPPAEEVAP